MATLIRETLERRIKRHTKAESTSCSTLIGKRVSPHVLRHSTAMELLHHGVDQSVIALWLGHESVETTQIYMHADLPLKEKDPARIAAPASHPGRDRPDGTVPAAPPATAPRWPGTPPGPPAPAHQSGRSGRRRVRRRQRRTEPPPPTAAATPRPGCPPTPRQGSPTGLPPSPLNRLWQCEQSITLRTLQQIMGRLKCSLFDIVPEGK